MKVLGIELKTPSREGLRIFATLSLIYVGIVVVVAWTGLLPFSSMLALMIGSVGGSLAHACGCSIPEHGVRGVIVTAGFSVILAALCVAMYLLINL